MNKPLTLIAAHARNGAIGRRGEIPWHYSQDFAHFKRETLGHTLIMGRSTWDSIGRPLPGRHTIVLTRSMGWTPEAYREQVTVAHDLGAALELAEALPGLPMVAGGGQVYTEALPLAQRQILTEIPLTVPDADAFYPSFPESEWKEVRLMKDEAGLRFRWLER